MAARTRNAAAREAEHVTNGGAERTDQGELQAQAAAAKAQPRKSRTAANAAKVREAEAKQPAVKAQPAANASKQPSTKEQRARLEELYSTRQIPEEKKRAPENFSKLGAARMINLLESYPLLEEATAQPRAGKRARMPRGAKAQAQPAETRTGYSGSGATVGERTSTSKRTRGGKVQTAAKGAKTAAKNVAAGVANGATAEAKALAKQVVKLRDTDGLSWLKIGAKLNLSDSEQPKAGASRARTLYRSIKGADADTGPLAK